jgi:hypothetical protein
MAFKKEEHPFRIAIVCAMWLTGFDVSSLATLYNDATELPESYTEAEISQLFNNTF